jgi:hypothetical protein
MTPPLQPPDSLHLQAAQGWCELHAFLEANDELEKNCPAAPRPPPPVLEVRWHIYAHAKKWDACVDRLHADQHHGQTRDDHYSGFNRRLQIHCAEREESTAYHHAQSSTDP